MPQLPETGHAPLAVAYEIDPRDLEPAARTKERDILLNHTILEIPLLRGMYEVYDTETIGKRGWALCGPTGIGFMNSDHEITDVPIFQTLHDSDLKIEHLDTIVRIQKPYGDNTIWRYFTGVRGEYFNFDAINSLYNGSWNRLDGAIDTGIKYVDDLDFEQRSDLEIDLRLFPYSYSLAALCNFDLFDEGRPTNPSDYYDVVEHMNSLAVFEDDFITSQGRIFDTSKYWGRTLKLAMGKTFRNVEDMLRTNDGRKSKLPGDMDADEYVQRLRKIPHIMPKGPGSGRIVYP